MVEPRQPLRRHVRWLWLSVMSFTALMLLIAYQTRWVYPEIHAYFSQSGNLTGQQLATRARVYLQQGLDLLLTLPRDSDTRERAYFQLKLAYSLFDIGLYRRDYPCTEPSLAAMDDLLVRLQGNDVLETGHLRESLLEPMRCLTEIEMHQLDRRSTVTAEFVEQTRRHQGQVLLGSLVIFVMGLGFWLMHELQRRRAARSARESLEWMAKALCDPLTGVGNRSAMHDHVTAAWGSPMGLLLVDIDFFKQYNDSLGHPDGDRLLRRLVQLIEGNLEHEARLYRLGGDEFAVLFACHDAETLDETCRSLVESLRAANLPHPSHPHSEHVTFSVGAVRFTASHAGLEAGYVAADGALYQVKSRGRDGWAIASLDMNEVSG
ncbi:MAG: GGDEF domain-containing protein [Halomonas sp.]|jgi:diguanylate cyclase (GGDEF)-like protein|uniref:diguanylate cyclase n=1 Tax=Billgrantia tianxiuensis TaxID=2497861 RepID=A0A6I6SGU9_9GAMM|nr:MULTISPECIES: GGDEF domain-containing protein [Halomonas]MCE8032281.1 GGDEF domain-containing protein [Halomonas sp. MCCC 1A11057]MDX5433625.1 GGDEF domain-containing protein [Halomonas sp.]QHC49719.1 GGDEF domain-containing protein [Halomonas tianxiuensis]